MRNNIQTESSSLFSSEQIIPVGVDFGTSNSCCGIYINGNVKISSNKIGERITPSVVLFKKNEGILNLFVGEEAISNNFNDNLNNFIYEIKRFIGLNYKEFEESGFKDSLNYEVENIDDMPQIKIDLDGDINYFTVEEICSYIIKRIINNTEDFISSFHGQKSLKIENAVFTIPTQFTEKQKESIKNAAKKAGIKVPRLIYEPTAAALAYEIERDLDEKDEKTNNLFCSTIIGNDYEVALSIGQIKKTEEKVISFDLGGGTLDLTILKIKKEKDNNLIFDVLSNRGDIHLGGSDFDKKLIDYCIKYFCKENQFQEIEIKSNNNCCRKLKIKCENAKKLLSVKKDVIIQIDNFYQNTDLIIKIRQKDFKKICKSLFDRINTLIDNILNELRYTPIDIDKIILVGGATRIYGIKDLLIKKFGEDKIKDNINPEEAVAIGATLDAAKIQINEKLKFTLQDIVAYNIGIETKDPDEINNNKKGIMHPIIKKYSKIPCTYEEDFDIDLTDDYPDIIVNIYEGNNKDVKKNNKLGGVNIQNLGEKGKFNYTIKLGVDFNGKLSGFIISKKLNINKEIIFKNKNTIGYMTGKRIKIPKTNNLGPISNILTKIKSKKEDVSKSRDLNVKYRYLNDCSKLNEILIDNYKTFIEQNDYIYDKIFTYTKDLFLVYSDIIKMKKEEHETIIQKIKERMMDLIKEPDYVEKLLSEFEELRFSCKKVFFKIFVNYIELLNNKGLEYITGVKISRYYAKLYLEKAFFSIKNLGDVDDLSTLDNKIKESFDHQKAKNEDELNKLDSFATLIEIYANGRELIVGNTGFTNIKNKLDLIDREPTYEELLEILDILHNMLDSFDKNKKLVEEAYCLANIIHINYEKLNCKDLDILCIYIERLKFIMKGKNWSQYSWYNKIIKIIKEIKKE